MRSFVDEKPGADRNKYKIIGQYLSVPLKTTSVIIHCQQ